MFGRTLLVAVPFLTAAVVPGPLAKIGDGQCNGGVGGIGEHKCMYGGACNAGGTPSKPVTETGTSCPGSGEYLLCIEYDNITMSGCKKACEADSTCVGFMVSHHLKLGGGRCELHSKKVTIVADPLQCYEYSKANSAFALLGYGPCRTKVKTVAGAKAGTYYGNMEVEWVADLDACKSACKASTSPCIGVEYHVSPRAEVLPKKEHKCEIHYEELGIEQMVTFQCWAQCGPDTQWPCTGTTAVSGALRNSFVTMQLLAMFFMSKLFL